MAYILEPTSNYAAFYTGVSTPFIVTTLAKDSEPEAKAIQHLTQENKRLAAELNHFKQNQALTLTEANSRLSEHNSSSTDNNNASGYSAMRSIGSVAVGNPPSVGQYSINGYYPQTQSRHFRLCLSRWQTFQAFLKAL